MKSLQLIIFVALLVATVSCLPSRVRRQFNWGQFENPSDDILDRNFRVARRGQERWNENQVNWGRNQQGRWNQGRNQQMGRQLPPNLNGNQDNNGVTSTTSDGTTRAPVSYTNCMSRCQYTRQYNPVCGTDTNTYNNIYELQCAASCGRTVSLDRGGTCQPL